MTQTPTDAAQIIRSAPDAPVIERLRNPSSRYSPVELRMEAADLIERLTAERDAARAEATAINMTIQDAAILLADWIDSDMVSNKQLKNALEGVTMETPVRHWLSQSIRALAGATQ